MSTLHSNITPQNLAAAAANGDQSALTQIWQHNRRWIAAVLLAHKPASADVDDLLQEVAMTLVRKIDTVREHRHINAWLRTVAINTARADARSRNARPSISLQENHDVEVDAAQTTPELGDLEARLQQLPEDYREPLLLRAVHGLRSRQIAEILDLSEATVDTRVARARRMLRDTMQRDAIAGRINTQSNDPKGGTSEGHNL